ncbi:palmitoyl-acyl carrier protein thioesterase, chloroplastic-like [Euphorbia lathyris]|uniref:palmitoyl-acyl carrier protein thioesterase, chloroplastic-like n=1 Tax=Euphorbia lathyris TaxID=212925 RepID=UPI0033134925
MASPCGLVMMNKQIYVHKKESQMKSPMKLGCISSGMKSSVGVGVGRMVKNGLVYRQNLMIRSFEIGFDGKLSITSLINYLQDTALNHGRMLGIVADGPNLGITKQMSQRDLIWVLSSLQILVDHYPSWLDVVEIETWMHPSGQNGLSHDWIIRDRINGHSVARASSVFVLMNKETRKLSKFINEVREEMAPHMMNCKPIFDKYTLILPQIDMHSATFARAGLRPGWNDLDVNQHVNNAKYINWILESVPRSLMEHNQLSVINLKYLRECNMDSEMHSLSKIVTKSYADHDQNQTIELEHLLRFDKGLQIVSGRTIWKPNKLQ